VTRALRQQRQMQGEMSAPGKNKRGVPVTVFEQEPAPV